MDVSRLISEHLNHFSKGLGKQINIQLKLFAIEKMVGFRVRRYVHIRPLDIVISLWLRLVVHSYSSVFVSRNLPANLQSPVSQPTPRNIHTFEIRPYEMLVNSKGRYLRVGVGLTSQEIDKPTLHSILNLSSSGHFGGPKFPYSSQTFWGKFPFPTRQELTPWLEIA